MHAEIEEGGTLHFINDERHAVPAKRELTFPDTREAGLEAGKGIADDCTADPNGLLFAIVDKHVRRIAEAAGDALNGPHFQHSA